jgi:hypothetical protein
MEEGLEESNSSMVAAAKLAGVSWSRQAAAKLAGVSWSRQAAAGRLGFAREVLGSERGGENE